MKLALAIGFLLTAMLYASVGLGGGSTYTALLAISGAQFFVIPIVSLACNITVVSGNSVRFARAGLVRWRRIAPLIAFSLPAAWLGGRWVVSETLFIGLLCLALLIAGLRLLFSKPTPIETPRDIPIILSAVIGITIGFYSGIVGIGGGIFLAPILYFLCWGTAREIAAATSIFILANSLSGLLGQLQKLAELDIWQAALPHWPLIPAVFIGGWIGNRLSLSILKPEQLRRLTGFLILFVAARLAFRWVGLAF